MSRETIFAEIAEERRRQDAKFGGAPHDDNHSATDWVSIIVRHLGLAVDDGSPAGVCMMDDHCAGFDPARYRRQMVRVAAVAVAALEVFDRKAASAPPAAADPLARMAQAAADEAGEPVLLVRQPPPGLGYDHAIPYAVRESQAGPKEKAAPHEVYRPAAAGGPGRP